ncbi:MAG: arsenosugar biosynthesis radical SAM (seleno)protein ArsS, partial [Arenicellales bacterium]
PKRTELMTWETMERILAWAKEAGIKSVDLTGGAPEMNPHFKEFILGFQAIGAEIISRCNLTILMEPGYEDLAQWYADHKIKLVSSLPCYTKENVEAQRGKGVFGKSIEALQKLNKLGYASDAVSGSALPLDLVYNPGGPFLPPAQASLELEYRTRLKEDFNITFSNLFAITNLPIKRFEHFLKRTNQLDSYQSLLVENFNPSTVEALMCRQLVSVDWLGNVYDCDFNQMLEMPLAGKPLQKVWEIDAASLDENLIAVDKHCYGCTAGAGSSCGGALE